jgi:DHA2 family multidrug resistance protein
MSGRVVDTIYPPNGVRRIITVSVMAATIMNSLDTTIANVALPHIQGSVSASSDEITWVLTSYIVAVAIMTPLSGWLASRFGRKRVILWSIVIFTLVSGLCGVANSLGMLVFFRLLQGLGGAALVPLSQAILLDINPPERHGPAMAIWGMGAILGPIIGPSLGGWLTDNMTWRWVFYINLPVGVLAFAGLSAFLPDDKGDNRARLDFFGYGTLALAIGCLQLMLDRGQTEDWFDSAEIIFWAGCTIVFAYICVVHTMTAKRPFIDRALFADRNFLVGSIFGFFLGVILFSVLALLPPMLEGLMGYPVVLTGLVTAPRGVGSMIAMTFVGFLSRRVDPRLLILVGFLLAGVSMHMMSGFSLGMDARIVIESGLIQGIGTGLVFVPLTMIAFATLDVRFRNEGAAMFSLIRNIGSAVGISLLQVLTTRNSAAVHARLVEGIRPDNPILQQHSPGFDFDAPLSVARMNAEITRQAMMVAYTDAFWLLFGLTILTIPLLLLMRPPEGGGADLHLHMD